MIDTKAILKKLDAIKYPLLILAFGVFLMLLPSGRALDPTEEETNTALERVLSCSDGVGEVRILISETGVIVACEGAENPKLKFDILHAIGSYTGFGSERITILKMVK